MIESFEDEDIILENSPLNQYLTEINLGNDEIGEVILKSNECHSLQISMLLSIALKNFVSFQCFIKRKLLANRILSILTCANDLDILNETDEMYLRYLIDTRFVQWGSVLGNKSSLSVLKPLFTLNLIFILIYFLFGKFLMGLSIVISIVAYLILLLGYGIFIRYLISFFFKRLVLISMQSRQTILLIQELLSLNQGYSKLVHLKDNSNFDCSKSFNKEFVAEFSRQLFSTLSHLSSFFDKYNNDLIKLISTKCSLISEVPWFQEELNIYSDYAVDELNCKQPISQLKNLHNSIQIQFAECVKSLILWTYCLDNHPSFKIPISLLCNLHEFTNIVQQLSKYRKILQIKTKSNVTHNTKKECHYKSMPFIGLLRTLELHLFEISEFSTQLSENIVEKKSSKYHKDMHWLISQRQLVDRSRKHFVSLQACWQGLCDEMDLLQNDISEAVSQRTTDHAVEKILVKSEELKEPIIIDSYPEIVDEVIEGMPDEVNNELENNYRNQLVDPFEEKFTTNSKAILNELKSVIEVRAKDWKKREKLALKRRAAEGKFVFNRDRKNDGNNFFDDSHLKRKPKVNITESECILENTELDFDFRRSLGEMVLKQRQNMISDSNFIVEDEECFCD